MALTIPSAGDTASAASDLQQFKDHLEGASGSTLAWYFRAAATNNITFRLADNAGTYKLSILDSDGSEVAYVDSDGGFSATSFTPSTFILPTAAAPTPTTEGEMWWDTDDDVLRIGTGSTTATLDPASAVVNHADLGAIGANDHHNRSHTWASASDHTGTAWRMVYTDGSGAVTELGLGTSGYHLKSNGSAAAPAWEAAGGAHATDHSDGGSDEVTVENLATASADTSRALRPDGAGGLAFSDVAITDVTAGNWKLFASNGSGVITEIAHGTSTYVLTSNGAAAAPTWQDPAASVALHASTHIRGASDEIDGDRLDIDWNPSNYTPATTPTEVTSVDHLTAHLYGLDQALSHTIASHSDTTATGTELETLTDGSNADALHTHTLGVTIKSRQEGTCSITTTSSTADATITAVTIANVQLGNLGQSGFANPTLATAANEQILPQTGRVYMQATTTVRAARGGPANSSTTVVGYEVLEWQ